MRLHCRHVADPRAIGPRHRVTAGPDDFPGLIGRDCERSRRCDDDGRQCALQAIVYHAVGCPRVDGPDDAVYSRVQSDPSECPSTVFRRGTSTQGDGVVR